MSDPLSMRQTDSQRLKASGGLPIELREGDSLFTSAGEDFGPGELGEPEGLRCRERFVPQPPNRVAYSARPTNLYESPPPRPQHVTGQGEGAAHRAVRRPDRLRATLSLGF